MSNNKPTHRAVINLGTREKPFYQKIGAGWAQQEGPGINLKLDLIPTDLTATVTIWPVEAKDEQAEEEGAR